MPLSWNEIKSRALAFGKERENDISEDAEAKSFWDDFFNVFGISRRRVLDARASFPNSSLADLYDPNTMPPVLVKAHQQLDKAVDLCYRPQPFINEAKRIEFLFELYDKYTSGMFVKQEKRKVKK